MEFMTSQNFKDLVDGVIVFPLKVNRDSRGILVETLKCTWNDIFNPKYPFGQNYYSITSSGVARDETFWHVHPNQTDRFVVAQGEVAVAIYDWQKESQTFGRLNLFKMGEDEKDEGQYLLLIPKNVLHGFCVVSQKPALLLNFPSLPYSPSEEGRVSHEETGVNLPDGQLFNWELVRKYFKI